jgi:ion channel-forming bestrophin family protein
MNGTMRSYLPTKTNQAEHSSFLRNALSWSGSITPKVMSGVLISVLYCLVVTLVLERHGQFAIDIGPFEYSGVVLGLLLVFRVNSGYDRWWEARKLWGSIVNQSRNLAIIGLSYSNAPESWRKMFAGWVAAFPYVMKDSLRSQEDTEVLRRLVGESGASLEGVVHSPSWVAVHIAQLLNEAKSKGWMDGFSFQRAERERAILIDDIGACERILKTPIPFVVAIKLKRFIMLFLILLPFALSSKLGYESLIIDALIAYPLFSLDRIGYELQNPFSKDRLSHLPLDDICSNIENNINQIEASSQKS